MSDFPTQYSEQHILNTAFDAATGTMKQSTSTAVSNAGHGSNRDVDTSAELLTSTSFSAQKGVMIKADRTNTGVVYVGKANTVTAGTTDATDGWPLDPGEAATFDVNNPNLLYVIGSANNQVVYWWAN